MAFSLQISTGASTPIYRQIVDQISVAIASGKLPAGSRLPSVRAVADELVINPNTVARAYGELTSSGAVFAQPGRGLFVAAPRQRFTDEERLLRLDRAVADFLAAVALLGFDPRFVAQRVEAAFGAAAGDAQDHNPADGADLSEAQGSGSAVHAENTTACEGVT